jgi:hypothetical protein
MRMLLVCALLTAGAVPAAALEPVTRIDVVAKPAGYIGKCPANLSFIATLHVTRWPVDVSYQWERSDGTRTPRQHVEIRGARHAVTDLRRVGARGQRLRVWERLHVFEPNAITSRQARAVVTCR